GVSTFGSRAGFASGAPVPQPPVSEQIFFAAALVAASTRSGRGGVAAVVSCSTTIVACPASVTETVRYFVVFAPGTCPKTAITPVSPTPVVVYPADKRVCGVVHWLSQRTTELYVFAAVALSLDTSMYCTAV